MIFYKMLLQLYIIKLNHSTQTDGAVESLMETKELVL